MEKFISETSSTERRLDLEVQIIDYIVTLLELSEDIQSTLKGYLRSTVLICHGIINYDVIHPQDLQIELEKLH